jgi:7-keto-8-aminopelargonate synthetase-like enzyme
LSKAFSSYAAFVVCHSEAMRSELARNAYTYIFSGPSPVASIATLMKGIEVNRERGGRLRAHVYRLTRNLVDGARSLGFEVENTGYFPIAGVVIGEIPRLIEACRILWDHGILITPGMFPAVPANRSLLRFSVTAANTEAEVVRALGALEEIRARLFEGRKSCCTGC